MLIDNSELFIKVIDAEDNTIVEKLEGHSKGVRRVTWDPTNMYLVSLTNPTAITFALDHILQTSCGSDGKILIWDMSSKQAKIEKILDGVIPALVDPE